MAGGCGSDWWRCERRRVTTSAFCFLLSAVFLLAHVPKAECSMDITAFEYFRKFGKHLELGECPQREVLVTRPDNTTFVKPESCKARQKGNITNWRREINDTRHVIIPAANDLMAYLGLCGGKAASYLGILNNGDCIAVEIASKLSFNRKTMIRAYMEYYRKSFDILDFTSSGIREGFAGYLSDKFYVKNRSYGTLEIILVQYRFRSRKQREQAKDLKVASNLMSEYMKKVAREVGKPRNVMVLSLSTATEETYKLNKYDEPKWGLAVRDVELREVMITQRSKKIESGMIRPHLNYQLFPFVAKNVQNEPSPRILSIQKSTQDSDSEAPLAGRETSTRTPYRTSSPLIWEQISLLEVSLKASIRIAKKTAKRCRKNRSKECRRVRELRRKLVALQAEIHKGRSNWMTFDVQEQHDFSSRYTARVETFRSVTKKMAADVRRMKKQEKLERINSKKRRRNQVPLEGRIRRLQHKRSRMHVHRLKRRREQLIRG